MIFDSLSFIILEVKETITKTPIINSLEKLSENLTIDQIVDHLIFIERVQRGLDDSEIARVNTKNEAKLKLQKWLK